MTQEQLRKLQEVQLILMDEIHRVCIDNGLTYYMIGGTALGAIRHKGFIPWDFDIDIAMPREDYERFVLYASKSLQSGFTCHDYRSDKNHYSPHAVVALDNSVLYTRVTQANKGNQCGRYGIFIDVLPLDRVPNDPKLRKKHAKDLDKIKRIIAYKKGEYSYNDSLFVKICRKILKYLIPISLYSLREKQQSISQRYTHLPIEIASDICSTLSHYEYGKLCMPAEVWGKPTLYEFEKRHYFGQEQIIKYLELLFGDYKKLPSRVQQEKSRSFVLYAEWIIANKKHSVGAFS